MKISPLLALSALALLPLTPRAAAGENPGLPEFAAALQDPQQPARAAGRGRSSTTATPTPGLRMAPLNAASPQASGGLGSTARGLTPTEEWRRHFPVSKK